MHSCVKLLPACVANSMLCSLKDPIHATSFLALLFKGGWVMAPMLLLSMLVVYAVIERLLVLRKWRRLSQQWIDALCTQMAEGDLPDVETLCTQKPHAVARILQIGIAHLEQPAKAVAVLMDNAGQRELRALEKNLALLGTIAGAAPMLGFLGTVLGMIQAFMAMAQATQQVSPQLLSGGIYEAMITTAAGLVVGIVAYLSYHYFLMRVQKAAHAIEQISNQFLALVERRAALRQPRSSHEA